MANVDWNDPASAQHVRPAPPPSEHEIHTQAVLLYGQTTAQALSVLQQRFQSPNNPDACKIPSTLVARYRNVKSTWLKCFIKHNQTRFDPNEHTQSLARSTSDYGFLALCVSMLALDKAYTQPIDTRQMITIMQCHVLQTVMTSNHDMIVRSQWPEPEDVNQVLGLIARVVHAHFLFKAQMASLVAMLDNANCAVVMHDENYAGLAEHAEFISLKRQMQRYNVCHMPPGLARQLKDKADKARARKETARQSRNLHMTMPAMETEAERKKREEKEEDEDDSLKEESVESMGYMWRTTADEMVANFVPKMARFVWKIMSDRVLLARYAPADPSITIPVFEDATHQRVREFLVLMCKTEQDPLTLAKFRLFTAEFCLAAGWETHHSRSGQANADDVTAAADILNDMLGVRLTGFVRESTNEQLIKIVADSMEAKCLNDESIHYQPIFLTQVDAFLQRRQKFVWSERYYCVLPHKASWTARFESAQFLGETPRPIVVKNLQKQFYVFYKFELLPCGFNFIIAFLLWLYICHRDFRSTWGDNDDLRILLEDGEDVACIYHLLQPRVMLANHLDMQALSISAASV